MALFELSQLVLFTFVVFPFFQFSVSPATGGFLNNPLCSEREGPKPYLLSYEILARCFLACFGCGFVSSKENHSP